MALSTYTTRPGHRVVYRAGILVGTITDALGQPGLLYPAVIAPTGESHSLYPTDDFNAALVAVTEAAGQYRYQPHPIKVSASSNPATGEARHHVFCPTCHGGGLPTTPHYSSAPAAAQEAERDHHQSTGHPAVLVEHPRALPEAGPPTNSPYYR